MARVFVYGTLKKGFPNFHHNGGRRVAGDFVTVHPHPLYLVGERAVPWLLEAPGEGYRVRGEVYEVDDAALAKMDRLEGVGTPGGYVRVTVALKCDGALSEALAYLKRPEELVAALPREGPFAEYTPAQSERYRGRAR